MRSNKIHNVDLFTQAANEHFQKHIKTQSKQALMIIKEKFVLPRRSSLVSSISRKPRFWTLAQTDKNQKPLKSLGGLELREGLGCINEVGLPGNVGSE